MKPGESRSLASLASLPGDELTDIELNDEYVDADTGQSEAEELNEELMEVLNEEFDAAEAAANHQAEQLHDEAVHTSLMKYLNEEPDSDEMDQLFESCLPSSNT